MPLFSRIFQRFTSNEPLQPSLMFNEESKQNIEEIKQRNIEIATRKFNEMGADVIGVSDHKYYGLKFNLQSKTNPSLTTHYFTGVKPDGDMEKEFNGVTCGSHGIYFLPYIFKDDIPLVAKNTQFIGTIYHTGGNLHFENGDYAIYIPSITKGKLCAKNNEARDYFLKCLKGENRGETCRYF